jgi:glycosyltransferase involved in cell wall biosynthesis
VKTCSAIIPTHNRAETLERALNSVARQTVLPTKLIVIDDHSTDRTEELVRAWILRENPGFEVIYKKAEGRGVSAARNLGAKLAGAEWLAFLDSDDEWLPEKLEKQLALSDRFLLIHTQENWIRNGTLVSQPKKYQKSGGRIFNRCVDLCFVSPSTVLLKADLFNEMNGFREDFPVCEDYELWLRISALFDVGFIEQPLINKYGGHADQLSMQHKAMDYYRAKALVPILHNASLAQAEKNHAAQVLFKKCEILLAGYNKHGNLTNLEEVQGWRHSASEFSDKVKNLRAHQ